MFILKINRRKLQLLLQKGLIWPYFLLIMFNKANFFMKNICPKQVLKRIRIKIRQQLCSNSEFCIFKWPNTNLLLINLIDLLHAIENIKAQIIGLYTLFRQQFAKLRSQSFQIQLELTNNASVLLLKSFAHSKMIKIIFLLINGITEIFCIISLIMLNSSFYYLIKQLRMHTFNKRDFSIKTAKQKIQIEKLIQQFNQQLKIYSPNHQNFDSQRQSDRRLPLIQQRITLHSDRIFSQRLKYQHNLHTIICKIKDKMQNTRKSPSFKSTKKRKQILPESPIKLLNKTEFKIKSMSITQGDRHKNDLVKSYIQQAQKRLTQQKRKKHIRYQRFNFQPWGTVEQIDAIQTIQL